MDKYKYYPYVTITACAFLQLCRHINLSNKRYVYFMSMPSSLCAKVSGSSLQSLISQKRNTLYIPPAKKSDLYSS